MVTVATKLDVPIKLLFPRPDGCVYPVGAGEGSEAMKEYLVCKAKKKTMAMLGLGDVVVPGMVVGLALRFDLYMHYLKQQKRKDGQGKDEIGAGKGEVEKVPFINATGGWGERFWTSVSSSTSPSQPEKFSSSTSALVQALQARSFPKPYFYATVIGYLGGLVATVMVMQVWGHAQPALLYLVPGVLGMFWGTAVVRGDVGELWRYTEAEEEDEAGKKDDDKKKLEGKEEGGKTKDEDKKSKVADGTETKDGIEKGTLGKEDLEQRDPEHGEEKGMEEEWNGFEEDEDRGEQANGELGEKTEKNVRGSPKYGLRKVLPRFVES